MSATTTQPSASGVPSSSPSKPKFDPTDHAVLAYLQKKGLGNAVIELTNKLKEQEGNAGSGSQKQQPQEKSIRERLEEDESINRTQRSLLSKSTGGGSGYDRDSAWPIVQWGFPDHPSSDDMGVDEARAYVDAFVSLQLWVLSLPDESTGTFQNPIVRVQALMSNDKNISMKTVVEDLIKPSVAVIPQDTSSMDNSTVDYNLPPSAKPELLAVTFALLVHTYCELLEVGMETTAHMVRDAFKPIYEANYSEEYRDLYLCTTTEEIMRLNSHNSQHMEALSTLKTILVQIASYQLRREELKAQTTVNGSALDAQQQLEKDNKVAEYDRHIAALRQKYTELSQKATAAFSKMTDLPFLRRARAVRWQLTLSIMTYSLLSSFLNAPDDSVLAMSTLLQSKCELHVERRKPLPFIPACVLIEDESHGEAAKLNIHGVEINWATPAPRLKEIYKDETLPFPKFHLEEEYENETDAKRDKRAVEFNRALLVNGFRRLEALERKREFDVLSISVQKRLKEGEHLNIRMADALQPSILLTTLCANTKGPFVKAKSSSASTRQTYVDVSTIWDEACIGLCCAKVCQPDGRRIAVGCEDSAVRIWSTMDTSQGEPLQVLLGHRNGFPVFDVDWNRDGRSLLSCGGDGSVRLWDTMATGPFGDVAAPHSRSSGNKNDKKTLSDECDEDADTNELVSDLRPEMSKYVSGSALAVYRGHAPSSAVWSVAFSPSGYYFASAAGDATARLWTTDRPVPVRLFVGHTSTNVNCVEWHPNCNYIITGSDDKTARLWDIQSGRTVRLLTGCSAGVNAVRIDPTGRQAAVADYSGKVYLWDLGTGKKVSEFRTKKVDGKVGSVTGNSLVHALRFSACGTALATGGDDCCVRIWDVRRESIAEKPLITSPVKTFPTKQTMLLDLFYSRRNLLLAIGKYLSPTPLAPSTRV